MLDALARQTSGSGLRPRFFVWLLRVRQPRIGDASRLDIVGFRTFGGGLLGFVEDAGPELSLRGA